MITRTYPPAPDLAPFVFDYAFHDSLGVAARRRLNRYLPGPANICLLFDGGPFRMRIRNFVAGWEGDASIVFGPTSHLFEVESSGGRLITFGLTPLGWSRYTRRAAAHYANRAVDLAMLWDETQSNALRTALTDAGDDAGSVSVLDQFLRARLQPERREDDTIRRLHHALLDTKTDEVTTISTMLGLTPDGMRRLANRFFGFTPKILLRRQRFVSALMAVADTEGPMDLSTLAPGYHDRSHFIRDAKLFLGVTGRQFLRDMTPLMENLRQSRRARYGQPLQGLIRPGTDNVVTVPAAMPIPNTAA